jgi:hypothetical protein
MRTREIEAAFARSQRATSALGKQTSMGELQAIVKEAKVGGFKKHERTAVARGFQTAMRQNGASRAAKDEYRRIHRQFNLPGIRWANSAEALGEVRRFDS